MLATLNTNGSPAVNMTKDSVAELHGHMVLIAWCIVMNTARPG